ncbi:hypothetical protein [Streptomyces sp. NPDC057280]|uniref:hypothetical protein n=1 Tax=Streptomyces sp. NPDC057280 TaxID=3346081 RepID=UPI00363F1811
MSRAHIFRRLSTWAILPTALADAVADLGGNLTTAAQLHSLGGHYGWPARRSRPMA